MHNLQGQYRKVDDYFKTDAENVELIHQPKVLKPDF